MKPTLVFICFLLFIPIVFGKAGNFYIPDCIQCVNEDMFYMSVGASLFDIPNTLLNRRGHVCVDLDIDRQWIMLTGFIDELGCIAGNTTHLLQHGDPVVIYKEIIFQLKFLGATSPRCRRNLRAQPLPITTTTTTVKPSLNITTPKIPSGMRKMQAMLDLHNKFKAMSRNMPLDRALINAAAVLNPIAAGASFAERVEAYINSTMRPDFKSPNSTQQSAYNLTSSQEAA